MKSSGTKVAFWKFCIGTKTFKNGDVEKVTPLEYDDFAHPCRSCNHKCENQMSGPGRWNDSQKK